MRSDVFADATGRVHPFLSILMPTVMEPGSIRLRLDQVRNLVRAGGRQGFAFADVEENLELEVSLRMAADHSLPCWEILRRRGCASLRGSAPVGLFRGGSVNPRDIARAIRAFAAAPS